MQLTSLDAVLAAFEEELSLERELGTRLLDCDRGLLVIDEAPHPAAPPPDSTSSQRFSIAETSTVEYIDKNPLPRQNEPQSAAPHSAAPSVSVPTTIKTATPKVVLLHHTPLSPAANELMQKIRANGLHMSEQEAPLVCDGTLPKANNYVIFGFYALKKWFPGYHASQGMRITTDTGQKLTITYSPEYIIRFGNNEISLKKMKREMWQALKPLANAQ